MLVCNRKMLSIVAKVKFEIIFVHPVMVFFSSFIKKSHRLGGNNEYP